MHMRIKRLTSLACVVVMLFSMIAINANAVVLSTDLEQATGQAEIIQRAAEETTGPHTFSGPNLAKVDVPMGGIGTGAVYFDGNMRAYNWDMGFLEDRIFTNENSLFAISVKQGDETVTKKLRGSIDTPNIFKGTTPNVQLPKDGLHTNISQPINRSYRPRNAQGDWYVATSDPRTPSANAEDNSPGVTRSEVFTIPENCTQVRLLYSGGMDIDCAYVGLIDAQTGRTYNKITGATTSGNSQGWINMTERTFAVPESARGKKAFFEITDIGTCDEWGRPSIAVNVDDIQLRDAEGNNLNEEAGFLNGDFETGTMEHWIAWPTASSDLYAPEDMELVVEYPFATYTFKDKTMPVVAAVEMVNPMVPTNEKDSTTPTVLFNITVTNISDAPAEVSVLSTMANALTDSLAWQANGTQATYNPTPNTTNTFSRDAKGSYITFTSNLTGDSEILTQLNGSLCLWTDATNASYSAGAATADALIDQMKAGGLDSAMVTDNTKTVGGLAVPVTLQPGESKTISFNYAWYFPHVQGRDVWGTSTEDVGRRYAFYYDSLNAVVDDLSDRREQLLSDTRLYHDAMYDTNIPYYLIESVTGTAVALRSKIAFTTKDGSIYGREGSDCKHYWQGCCLGNCTHVYAYVQALPNLYPELARRWKEQDFAWKQRPDNGLLNSRFQQVPAGAPWSGSSTTDGNAPAVDGVMGTIEGCYREHLNSPDNAFLTKNWANIKRLMDSSIAAWDPDELGLLTAAGNVLTTFDGAVAGITAFTGSQYLTALKAAEQMALIMGDTESVARYAGLFAKGTVALNELTWNGEYYTQANSNTMADCLMVDQLNGQARAYLDQLGYILPSENVKTALQSMFKYNFYYPVGDKYNPFSYDLKRIYATEKDPGLLNGTYPHGTTSSVRYLEEIWTGFEYSVATAMLYEGMVDEALAIAYSVRQRHNGLIDGMHVLNDRECKGFYSRAMAAYGMLNAAIGLERNGPAKSLGFNPNYSPEDVKGFFTYVNGWGSFEQSRSANGNQKDKIDVKYGAMDIKELVVYLSDDVGDDVIATAQVNSIDIDIEKVERDGNRMTITFTEEINLKAGDILAASVAVVPAIVAEVVPTTIVNGYAANVKVNVDTSSLDADDVVTVSLFGQELIVVNGAVLFKFVADEIPAAGVYSPVIQVNGTTMNSSAKLTVEPKNDDIWTVDVLPGETDTVLGFIPVIAPKTGASFEVLVNNVKRTLTWDGSKTLVLTDCLVQPGDEIVIKNVKYPILFPSYSFTFNFTYNPQ